MSNHVLRIAVSACAASLCAVVPITGVALAADALEPISIDERMSLPAVSQLNAKLEAGLLKFDIDDDSDFGVGGEGHGKFVQGAVSVPLGQLFGLQIDAGALEADGDSGSFSAHGIGAHLFWRDPSIGLLGLYGHHVDYDFDVTVQRFGVEGEAYLGDISLEGFVGKDMVDTDFGDENFTAAEGRIAWYATPDLRLDVGVDHSFEQTALTAGLEWHANTGPVSGSLFADASFHDDATVMMAGVKLYAGGAKSLKARHREDDPSIDLFDQTGNLVDCVNNMGASTTIPAVSARASSRIAVPAPAVSTKRVFNGCDEGGRILVDF